MSIPGILEDFDALLPPYTYVEGGGYAGTASKKSVTKGFRFKPGCTFKKLKAKSQPKSDPVDISLRHNAMQHKLFDRLVAKHGKDAVGTEIATGNGTRIDVAVKAVNLRLKRYQLLALQTVPVGEGEPSWAQVVLFDLGFFGRRPGWRFGTV